MGVLPWEALPDARDGRRRVSSGGTIVVIRIV